MATATMVRAYSAATFVTPTLFVTAVSLVELPGWSLLSAIGVVVLVWLAAQQLAWLRRAGHITRPRRLPAVGGTTTPALVCGMGAATALGGACVIAGGAAVPWAMAPAPALGVLCMATARWRRDRPVWSRQWTVTLTALAVLAAAVLETACHLGPGGEAPGIVGGACLVASLLVVLVLVGQLWWDRTVVELARSRAAVVAQALTLERLRFAGELHDLQGAELQRILVQADLGQALLRDGSAENRERAAETFLAIRGTAEATLRQARQIAHGYRQVDLAQELANAREVLESIGVTVIVEGRAGGVPRELAPLVGLVIRESTTNVLRHSAARFVRITLAAAPGELAEVIDDGPPTADELDVETPGSGLRELARRATDQGCVVEWGARGSGWRTAIRSEGGQ